MYRFLFPFSLFLSASLLFVVQPLVAKVLLPVYGGTPAVWTACMLFFQVLLLAAYAYAWMLSRFFGVYRWRVVHLLVCVASLTFLPLAFSPMAGTGMPEIVIVKNLLLQLGLPLLVIGASAPLLQYAFSQAKHSKAGDPYFLYAASNAGSLLALLSYPWLVERFFKVGQQFYAWNIIYVLYLVLLIGILLTLGDDACAKVREKPVKLALQRKAFWVFLSFVPCSLMLGVTFYISTDIAATPLFWVLPLALYLLSFVITFSKKPFISHAWVVRNIWFFLLLPLLGFIIGSHEVPAWQMIVAHLTGFFMLALLCHGELVSSRPAANQLTTFYFCLALGGVLAGLFNSILAPAIFYHAYEYPLAVLLSLLCIPLRKKPGEWQAPVMVLSILLFNYFLPDKPWIQTLKAYHLAEILALSIILFCSKSVRCLFFGMAMLFVFIFMPWLKPTQILSQQRNFYGIKQVFSQAGAHVLMSQSTIHGFQVQDGENASNGAMAYYGAVLPVVKRMQSMYQPLHAMVLGLGTGIMACQFGKHDKLTVVEIDQQVIDIASNPNLFTYMRDCASNTVLIHDDARLAAAKAQDAAYELLVMDAFNSDAVPVHLLTLEAFGLYQQKITADGVILVNISNRHLRLLPVLTAAGRQLDMIVLQKQQPGNSRLGQLASQWALLTKNERLAGQLMAEGWRFVTENDSILWTNDYSNLVPLIKWL